MVIRRDTTLPNAPPRSLLRKLHHALSEACRGDCHSVDDLADRLIKRGYLDFTFFDARSGEAIPCSKKASLRAVSLCVTLGFIDNTTARPTPRGLRAAGSREEFNRGLRDALKRELRRIGVPIEDLLDTIRSILKSEAGRILPTWDVLYDKTGAAAKGITQVEFRELLVLLSSCEGIAHSRQKIYLP